MNGSITIEAGLFKEMRKKAEMTIEEAAWKLFINERTLAKYEKGTAPTPKDVQIKMKNIYLQKGGEISR